MESCPTSSRAVLALAASVALSASAGARTPLHEQPAHAQITRDAIRNSARFDAALAEAGLAEMPLSSAWTDLAQRVPGIRFDGQAARDIVIAGSVLEDGVPGGAGELTKHRCLRHFQDTGGSGWLTYTSAQAWAFGADGSVLNSFTWHRALAEYAHSVLGSTFDERRQALEHALVALGCNLHLIQDQYSPAHTRDDPHPGHHIPLGEFLAGSSLLEVEGSDLVVSGMFSEPVPLIALGKHADFFKDAVQWTASRFFSDDTIFELGQPQVTYTDDDTCSDWLGLLDDEYALSTIPGMVPTKLAYRQFFFPITPAFGWSLQGSSCDESCDGCGGDASLAIVHDNLKVLVPRAIGSSAGLLDHFFRGRIEVGQNAQGDLVLTNRSSSIGTPWNAFEGGRVRIALQRPGTLDRVMLHTHQPGAGTWMAGDEIVIPAAEIQAGGPLPGPVAKLCIVYEGKIGAEDGLVAALFDYVVPTDLCKQICVEYGHSILAPAGDVDADGAMDLVRSDRLAWLFGGPWTAVYSSKGCQQVFEISSDRFAAQDFYPTTSDTYGIGDVDGDGHSDLLLVGESAAGVVRSMWMSGATQQLEEAMPDPWGYLPGPAGSLGDLDGDGKDEFFLRNSAVFSAQPITLRWGTGADRLDPLADFDGDGVIDLRSWHDVGESSLVSGATGDAIILPLGDDPSYEIYWYEKITVVQDISGDGVPDLLGVGGGIHGNVGVFSGVSGASIWVHEFPDVSFLWLGDWDGDGFDDCLIREISGGIQYRMISTAKKSDTIPPVTNLPSTFYCLVASQKVGDINGDGRQDYLCGQHYPPTETCYHFLFGGTQW